MRHPKCHTSAGRGEGAARRGGRGTWKGRVVATRRAECAPERGGEGRDLGLEEADGVALGDLELRELHEDLPGVGTP